MSGRQAGLDDDVVFEVKDALQILERHVQDQADAAGQRLQEPDMGDRRGQLDMAHAVAAHLLHRDFHAALFADDALVLHALVLAAQALIVLHRPEDAGAEQPVPFRLEGAVVDGLRLLDLAMAPAQDLIRAGQRNLDAVEGGNFLLGPEDIHQLLIHTSVLSSWAGGHSPVPSRLSLKSPALCRAPDRGHCVPSAARVTSSARSPAPHSATASAFP